MKSNWHSQNLEAQVIDRYFFDGFVGRLLDLGCNDAITFSNSYDLIKQGWRAVLVDASPIACAMAERIHEGNDAVSVHNIGLSNSEGLLTFYQSGAHVKGGSDTSLVSSFNYEETLRWRNTGVEFTEIKVPVKTWISSYLGYDKYDFISIDIEGYDWLVLQQIDLSAVGCKCLCIEWNSKSDLAKLYTDYCAKFGLKEIHRNAENIIYAI